MPVAYYGAQYINQIPVHVLILSTTSFQLWAYGQNVRHWWEILATLLIAHVVTDLNSAVLHFITEFFPDENWKLEKHETIAEEHHTKPGNYYLMTFFDKLSFAYGFQAPFLLLSFPLTPGTLIHGSCVFSMLFSLTTVFVHDWAHRRSLRYPVPGIIRWMQDHWLIMSGRHHNLHHFVNSSQNYGFFTGNTDFVTNRLLWKPVRFRETFPVERLKMIGKSNLEFQDLWASQGIKLVEKR